MGELIKAKYRWKNFSQQDFLNIPPINLPTQKKKKKKKIDQWGEVRKFLECERQSWVRYIC